MDAQGLQNILIERLEESQLKEDVQLLILTAFEGDDELAQALEGAAGPGKRTEVPPPETPVGPVQLVGSGTQRRVNLDVTVDGSDANALGVMSQGELHALALALFLPRATMAESPFRFLGYSSRWTCSLRSVLGLWPFGPVPWAS